MTKEMETRDGISEPVEILPEGIGEMPATEAAPLLERAASRTETLGWGGEFGKGLRENLRGASAWIKSSGADASKKILSLVTTATFLTSCISASAKGLNVPDVPSETSPRVMEVSPTITSTKISNSIETNMLGVMKVESKAPILVAEDNPIPLFDETQDALIFLEEEKGAQWLPGTFATEVTNFPESSTAEWNMFSGLKTVGYDPHYVLLVSNASGDKVSVIGVETIRGNTYLDFVDFEGHPAVIRIKGPPDYKTLQGANYTDNFFANAVMVWPNISFPKGDCAPRKRNPVTGVTDGQTCSLDKMSGFYFQYQSH
jgi:hypothetical protein